VSSSILLLDNVSEDLVEAVLYDRILPDAAKAAEDSWKGFIDVVRNRARDLSLPSPEEMDQEGWLWHKKVDLTHRLLPFPTLAIECAGEIQGMMLLRTDGYSSRLPSSEGKPIVYIELLSTAPWNLSGYTDSPKYSGVGKVLVNAAVQVSMEYGFKGRVGLNSLPRSESFYERLNFEFLERDADKQNLKYYELSAERASEFLE
jgi:hypothetical protein